MAGCKRKLAEGQWWSFCGEADMGQSLPALCKECGGEYVLAESVKKEDEKQSPNR